MITRAIAIVPALIATAWYGESGVAKLLIFSQVVLSMQLPFAVIPLIRFTGSRAKMGVFANPRWLGLLAGLAAVVIVSLNVTILFNLARSW